MGRAIIRSKIFAKQNIPGTGGGGGGSAITVYDEGVSLTTNVTSFNFTGLGIDATAAGNAVTVNVDNHTVIEVKNATAAVIPKGAVCYLNPSGTSATHPEILLASATSEATSSKTIGVAHSNINPGAVGLLIISGEIYGTGSEPLNTSAYNAGALLWLSTTAGQWTTTVPTFPNHSVFIGHVTRSQNVNGRVVIKIQNGFEMSELHDTKFSSLAQNDILMYDNATGPRPFWKNQKMLIPNTASDLLNLKSTNALVPGAWYQISDKPANWTVYIQAITESTLNPKGVALYVGRTEDMDCWYDLTANNPIKIYDPKYKNTVEGWITIEKFKWNNASWNGNYIGENSIVYVDGSTSITNFVNNFITDGSIVVLVGTTISVSFSNNTISGSSLDLTNNLVLTDVSYNTIFTSTIFAPDAGSGPFSYNAIESSNLEIYNGSTITYCNIFGMGFKSGSAVIDTGSNFEGCEYFLNGASTFYADYDLDDPAIYDGVSQVTLPFGHNQWVGEARVGGNAVPTYLITDIINFPSYHFLSIYNKNAGTCLVQLRDTTAFFKFYSGVLAPDLTYAEDYAVFTGIVPKIGPATGLNMVLLDYKKY